MTFEFNNVYIKNTSTISGPIEAKGPLNKYFDKTYKDFYINSKSLEKSEVNLQKESIETLIDKENITKEKIDILISGDLQNQITASSYAAKDYEIPFIGVYSACATSTQSIILASTIIESKKAKNIICTTSSNNLVSEKQFRNPVEYGAPSPKTKTFTSTGGASILLTNEKTNIKITSGPAIEKAGDLAALLTNLSEFDVLFIDEIHRLNKNVEEILYPALEDYTLDIIIGKGPTARSIRLDLPKFTLIGATTKAGSLSTPLRDRFGIVHRLELYTIDDLSTIIKRSSNILGVQIDEESSREIARRSRGTPRIANRLLKRVRDYAAVLGDGNITLKLTKMALNQLEIDDMGLDDIDRKLLEAMIIKYQGRPVGIDTLATTIGEEVSTIEDVYEPYLIQIGYIARTVRGRIALPDAYKHMGIEIKE